MGWWAASLCRAEQRLAAQHAGGGALGEPGRYAIRHLTSDRAIHRVLVLNHLLFPRSLLFRVQEDGGEALQARRVEEGGVRRPAQMPPARLREWWHGEAPQAVISLR